jgi:hypothetical protein
MVTMMMARISATTAMPAIGIEYAIGTLNAMAIALSGHALYRVSMPTLSCGHGTPCKNRRHSIRLVAHGVLPVLV